MVRTPRVSLFSCVVNAATCLPAKVSSTPSVFGSNMARSVLSTGRSPEATVLHAQYLRTGPPCLKFSYFPRYMFARSWSVCATPSWKEPSPRHRIFAILAQRTPRNVFTRFPSLCHNYSSYLAGWAVFVKPYAHDQRLLSEYMFTA